MEAGRELDALIAEKVFGMEMHQPPGEGYARGVWVYAINDFNENRKPIYVMDCPCYSTDIAAAWEVVEKIKGLVRAGDFTVQHWQDNQWDAGFLESLYEVGADWENKARGESAPHAICLAALKAVQAPGEGS